MNIVEAEFVLNYDSNVLASFAGNYISSGSDIFANFFSCIENEFGTSIQIFVIDVNDQTEFKTIYLYLTPKVSGND